VTGLNVEFRTLREGGLGTNSRIGLRSRSSRRIFSKIHYDFGVVVQRKNTSQGRGKERCHGATRLSAFTLRTSRIQTKRTQQRGEVNEVDEGKLEADFLIKGKLDVAPLERIPPRYL